MCRFMRNAVMFAICLGVVAPARALAQIVFFDDFDGDELLPHWSLPDRSRWEYNVSGGMLNVTGLFYPGPMPGHPDSGNFAAMGAQFAPQGDFRVDARMGWDPGDQPHRLWVAVTGAEGSLAARPPGLLNQSR